MIHTIINYKLLRDSVPLYLKKEYQIMKINVQPSFGGQAYRNIIKNKV